MTGFLHPNTTTLFVYGTLKHDDVRAGLLEGQTFLGETKTAPLFRLFNTGDYPAMVEARPLGVDGLSITGELWRVDIDCLARLDIEEGVDEGLYERRTIELIDPSQTALSYLYLHPVRGMADLGTSWPTPR